MTPRLRLPPRDRLAFAAIAAVALGAIAYALVDQLLVPPIVGLANNGDFERVMFRFGLYPGSRSATGAVRSGR